MTKPLPPPNPLTAPQFLSLGGGVQSITLALLAAHNLISPLPQAAIFADTHWEPSYVYDQIEWLRPLLPFPIITVSAGSIRTELLENEDITVPAFMAEGGTIRRQCTKDFKIRPILREVRTQLGMPWTGRPRKSDLAIMWLGISTDESRRQKDSWVKFIQHRHPLLELNMSRTDCESWMNNQGYPVPRKSACIGCPFHDDQYWTNMKVYRPQEFKDAVYIDKSLRESTRLLNEDAFLHRSCQPLSKVKFKKAPSLMLDECAGVCGI